MRNVFSSFPGKETAGPAVFRILLFIQALWFCLAALFVIFSRIAYPFDLEWMEGGSLVQVLRLLDGKALYVAPSLEYIPYIYPPFYYYAAAGLAKLTSLGGFLPLRLISFSSTVATAFLIFAIVRSETNSAFWSFLAAGFFAATFYAGGAWFDIARVDMLFVFLLLAAAYALQKAYWKAHLLAGLLFTCAFFTKQTALAMALGLLLYVFLFRQRRAAVLAAFAFVVSAFAWGWMENVYSSGWFQYYVFTLPGLHRMPALGLVYVGQPVMLLFPVCIAFCAAFARLFIEPGVFFKSSSGFWAVFGMGMLATSILASLNPGSFNNNYIPFYTGLSILLGINLPWLLQRFSASRQPFQAALLYTLCLVQFAVLFYNPLSQVPTTADLQAGQALVERLRQVPGDVLIPNHTAYAVLAGKPAFAHLIALQEIRGNFGRQETAAWNTLTAQISGAFATERFAAIVLDQPNPIWAEIPADYTMTPIEYSDPQTFWPVTGGQTRPSFFYTHPQSAP